MGYCKYDKYKKKIQKLQNFAAKVARGGGARRDPASPFIRELGWLKVYQKYKMIQV